MSGSQNSGLSIHLTLLPDSWLSAALIPPGLLPSTAEHDSFVFSPPATETAEASPSLSLTGVGSGSEGSGVDLELEGCWFDSQLLLA